MLLCHLQRQEGDAAWNSLERSTVLVRSSASRVPVWLPAAEQHLSLPCSCKKELTEMLFSYQQSSLLWNSAPKCAFIAGLGVIPSVHDLLGSSVGVRPPEESLQDNTNQCWFVLYFKAECWLGAKQISFALNFYFYSTLSHYPIIKISQLQLRHT